jgi:hypothetical protein
LKVKPPISARKLHSELALSPRTPKDSRPSGRARIDAIRQTGKPKADMGNTAAAFNEREIETFNLVAICDDSRMNYPLDQLSRCADASDLKRELRSLCSRFGAVMRLDVLMANLPGRRQAICMWRMESPEREEELMSELGVGRFAGDLVMVVDLQPQPVTTAAFPLNGTNMRSSRDSGRASSAAKSAKRPFRS